MIFEEHESYQACESCFVFSKTTSNLQVVIYDMWWSLPSSFWWFIFLASSHTCLRQYAVISNSRGGHFTCIPCCWGFPSLSVSCSSFTWSHNNNFDSILQEWYTSSLSTHKVAVLWNAASYTDNRYALEVESELTSIFSNHGVNSKAKKFIEIASSGFNIHLLVKPTAVLHMIASDISKSHIPFWKSMTVDKLYLLYKIMLC